MRREIRAAGALVLLSAGALVLVSAVACGGSEPESEYRWEEETVYEERGPAPPPRERYDDDERSRSGSGGHYGRRPRDRGPRGAIYAPKRGVFCDESVRSCYTAKGGHPGATEQEFGSEASKRLARRIDEEGTRGSRGIFRPGDGLLCDRLSEVCYDRDGADLRETRGEFGHEAAEELARRVDEPRHGPGRRGGIIYSPRKGVSCDEQVAVCYVADQAHPGHTKQQFGAEAARELERRREGGRDRRDGIYRPDGGAVCDRLAEVCYDRHGASAKLTREEFGRDAAAELAERLE